MKAEHRKALEKNELADKLNKALSNISATSPNSNRVWVIALCIFVAGIAWYLYSSYSTNRDAANWSNLEFAGDVKSLQKIVEDAPGTIQAQIARFHIARINVHEATGQLAAQTGDERGTAADKLETVRKTYGELAQASGLPSSLVQEAMLEHAKTEEILASVPKADNPTAINATTMRGSLDQASKYYAEVAKRFPKTFIGEQAAKRVERLKTKKDEIEKLYNDLAKDHAKTLPEISTPSLPALPLTPSPTLPPAPESPAPTPPPAPPK